MSAHQRQPSAEALIALGDGDIEVVGRMPWSSNFTFLVKIHSGRGDCRAVYKPLDGEQELWDFPPVLYKREIAAYELSRALGWPNIPPTLEREDAPFGVGSLQLFMPSDFEENYFTMYEAGGLDEELRRIAAFDVIANNTDRKAGHCLKGDDGNIYAIDNGLCFHEEPKLRTVIWEYEKTPVPEPLLEDIERVRRTLPTVVGELLDEAERDALLNRMETFLTDPVFPPLVHRRQYPWPVV